MSMENMVDLRLVEEPKKPMAMNAKKFGMWLFLASVMMIFMAFTSAYIVRRAEGNWVYFDLPSMFYITSIVIVVSSITMQLAYFAVKKDNHSGAKMMILITSILGIAFLVGQFMGWGQLVTNNVYFSGGNPSGSFFYVISGLHGLHVISAIIFLLIMLTAVFTGKAYSGNMTKMEMCTTYWHFLGGLWLYLFVFLLLYR